jgi:hypothetical protein
MVRGHKRSYECILERLYSLLGCIDPMVVGFNQL